MAYWIIKTEPSSYSFEQLLQDQRCSWDGVRNYQARNNLAKMKADDLCLVYHSVGPKEIVGVARVISSSYPDQTAVDGKWLAVDLEAVEKFSVPVKLFDIKAEAQLQDLALVKQGRLSVCPLSSEEWDVIVKMARVIK